MDHQPQSPWWPLEAEDLPGPEATLKDIIRFSRLVDPAAIFRRRWGEKFTVNSDALLHRCLRSFRTEKEPGVSPDDLLLCLDRQLAIAPYVGFSEQQQLPFLHWLIGKVRSGLQAPSVTFQFWFSDSHGIIRRRSNGDRLWHPEVWRDGLWRTGTSDVTDAITGRDEDPHSSGECADGWDERQAADHAARNAIDLFADNLADPHPPATSMPGDVTPILDFDGELRVTLLLRIVMAGRDAPIRFSFPRLHHQSDMVVLAKPE